MHKFIPIVMTVFVCSCVAPIQPDVQPDVSCGTHPLSACGTGTITFSLANACDLENVRVFVRRNGYQIVSASVPERIVFPGYCLYNITRSGFEPGDRVEQQWVADVDGIPNYWPGPSDSDWSSVIVGGK